MRSTFLFFFLFLVMIFLASPCFLFDTAAQSADTIGLSASPDVPHISWIKQWPPDNAKKAPHSFKSRFNSIFLGKNAPMLTRPVSIVAFSPEKFWLLDQGLNTIMQVDEKVGDIPHFISKAPAEFISLVSLCKTPADGLLFTDSGSKKIYRILSEKKKLLTLNDFPDFNQPTGIAYSRITGEIWVVETNSHRIIAMNANGEILRRIGSRGTGKGEFNYPTHLWIDKNGLAYVVDAMNFRIQVLDSAGTVVSIFGEQGDASGYFARPKGIATDSHGNIYVVDALFHVVQVFDLDGSFLFSFGAQGSGEGEFWMPSGIFIDDKDYIYVADSYNSRIQIFQTAYIQKP